MITWTKIDVGDGGAIWYSDCLRYQIDFNKDCTLLKFYAEYDDKHWIASKKLEYAKAWCEGHKKGLLKRNIE